MHTEIEQKIKELVALIRRTTPECAVAFHLFINHAGYEVKFTCRDANALGYQGISMRGLNGNWIERR